MCGRTACTLAPDEICKSLKYPNKDGKSVNTPQWRDHSGTKQYTPSHNMAPTAFTPIMFADHSVKRSSDNDEKEPCRIIQPMMWGLIPHFYKGSSPTGHGLSTNNCRVETITEKKMFIHCLKKGLRCVVLCDGFYEWQSVKGQKNKQPYFVYQESPNKCLIWDKSTWENKDVDNDDDNNNFGPQLLKIAGIFSKWISDEGEEIYNYTVLTMESEKKFGEIHHRVPAILDTEEKLKNWLNTKVSYEDALKELSNDSNISWHPVSTTVNNSRNNDPSCNVPVDINQKPPETAGSKFMSNWLKKK